MSISHTDPDQFIQILSAVDGGNRPSFKPTLDCSDPRFAWVFQNMDFELWKCKTTPSILCLSGPRECNINQISSHLLNLEQSKDISTDLVALSAFFSDQEARDPHLGVFTDLVHQLLRQIILS